MKEIKLWETKQKDNYIFFNDIDSYFKYLEENNLEIKFITKNIYTPGDITEDILDNVALRNNNRITYTDEEHPIAAYKNDYGSTYISPSFYEEHKEEFINYALNKFKKDLENNKSSINIPDFIFSEKIIDEILKEDGYNNNYHINECTNNFDISDKLKQKIKDNHLQLRVFYRQKDSEEISTKYIIGYNTMKDLKETPTLRLEMPIDNETIANLIYVNPSATITIRANAKLKIDELAYFKSIINVLNELNTHNKNYNIKIEFKNRELLRISNMLNMIPNNINLTLVDNKFNNYDLETYKKEEEKIEKLISPIRDSNLSPFEKYLAVYDIVKKFKPYKENVENPEQARDLCYILNEENEYIVCVGFANLLEELLYRVGINNKRISASVDVSYDKGYSMEEVNLDNVGHARNIILLNDDKYNIHGIYLSDSTWDNDLENDYYLNALMTFDRKKEAYRLERLTDEDLLFDFHDFEEFKEKLNYLLKTDLQNNINNKYAKTFEKRLINSYLSIYHKIMNILKELDYDKYVYFYDKYQEKFSNTNTNLTEYESIANSFLTEYGMYVLPISNNKVNLKTIIMASANVKKELNNMSDEEIKKWLEETTELNTNHETKAFPYKYNPENKTEAYLLDASTEQKHTK